jgi:hypothetical protein
MLFAQNSYLTEIGSFQQCTSLCRIEIPWSIKMMRNRGLNEWILFPMIISRKGFWIRMNEGLREFNTFLVFENDVKVCRSRTYLRFARIWTQIMRFAGLCETHFSQSRWLLPWWLIFHKANNFIEDQWYEIESVGKNRIDNGSTKKRHLRITGPLRSQSWLVS